ncbi:MAG: hypothetical protein Q8R92_04225, partial [Deltaproteobacteria bacterium]|nr:hypothetical protein [Deltaproteobacteria bacterium]
MTEPLPPKRVRALLQHASVERIVAALQTGSDPMVVGPRTALPIAIPLPSRTGRYLLNGHLCGLVWPHRPGEWVGSGGGRKRDDTIYPDRTFRTERKATEYADLCLRRAGDLIDDLG